MADWEGSAADSDIQQDVNYSTQLTATLRLYGRESLSDKKLSEDLHMRIAAIRSGRKNPH